MSSSKNHRTRSHRSQYRARAFNGSRRSMVNPTARKMDYFAWFRSIGAALRRIAGRKPGKSTGNEIT